MKVEITVPEDYLGDVLGDFTGRRGRIMGTDRKGHLHIIRGIAPLSDMFGYTTSLRSLTQGRGVFSMEFNVMTSCRKALPKKSLLKHSLLISGGVFKWRRKNMSGRSPT